MKTQIIITAEQNYSNSFSKLKTLLAADDLPKDGPKMKAVCHASSKHEAIALLRKANYTLFWEMDKISDEQFTDNIKDIKTVGILSYDGAKAEIQ